MNISTHRVLADNAVESLAEALADIELICPDPEPGSQLRWAMDEIRMARKRVDSVRGEL